MFAKMEGPCAYCQAPGQLRCSRCKGPFYCSTLCQKRDWKEHRKCCTDYPPPFTIEEDDIKGKHLVAHKSIALGTLVIAEKPNLIVRHNPTYLSPAMQKVLKAIPFFHDSSRGTKTFILVVLSYCDSVLAHKKRPQPRSTAHPRVPLKVPPPPGTKTGPHNVFDLYCPLEHVSELEKKEMLELAQILHKIELLQDLLTPQQMVELVVIFRNNAIDSPDGSFSALFDLACRLEHSCDPNAYHYMHDEERITVRVIKAIEPGQSISIAYIRYYQPAYDRQRALREHYYFNCQCYRCAAGLDLARAFTCAHCGGSAHPVGASTDSWLCRDCGRGVSTDAMTARRQAEAQLLQALEGEKEIDVVELLDQKFLKKTHYYVYLALINRVRQEAAHEHFSTVIALCEHIIEGSLEVCGPYSEPLYSNYCLLGRASREMELMEEARRAFQKAYTIAKVSCGPDSDRCEEVLQELRELQGGIDCTWNS